METCIRSESKAWNLPMLAGAFAATIVVCASWFVPGPWRDVWDTIDHAVFFTLNGMLADNQPMAVFWALANNRAYDLVPALIFLVLFWRYMTNGGPARELLERVTGCFLMVVFVLLVTQLENVLMHFGRLSPSLVLEPSHRLTEMVPWFKTKDSSPRSFPGDHGIISIMFSIFLIHCRGRRALGWAALLVVLSTLPRMVGGAHWLTDVAVGSLMIALPTMALFLATPVYSTLVRWMTLGLRRWLPWADDFTSQFFAEETPGIVGKGMCMGTADIIPGVSGGTMAYILGIYQRLLGAITVFNPRWFRLLLRFEVKQAVAAIPLFFLMPLAIGIVLAVVIFTKMIPLPYFVQYHPEPVYGLFFGLVGGSIVLLLRLHARPCVRHGLVLVAGIALGLTLVTLVPANTPDAPWFVFLCGMLAISAMLLPGISGSFILLILGKYALILGAIGDLDLVVLAPFALGCGIGLLTFAHSLRWLMRHYAPTMNLLITGLLIGTLRAVWPFQDRVYTDVSGKEKLIGSTPYWPPADSWLSLAGLMLLAGFAVIYLLDRLSRTKRSPVASLPGPSGK